jgi:cytochrome c2
MLPEQHDILWTFMSLAFSMFSIVAFANVVGHCRQRENVSTMFWGAIFGVIALVMMGMTNHLMGLIQGDQMAFLPIQVVWVFVCLTTWGVFFKSTKIEGQSPPITRAFFFWTTVSILLAGYTNWLPQQRSDPPPQNVEIDLNMTMDEYVNMGREIVFGSKPATEGNKAIGRGQCPLCHTFDPGDNIGRCPNLFGIEERSHTRVKEERYMTEPVKPGEEEPAAGIVKGRPDQIPDAYRRAGAGEEMTGEDYIRESMMCPSCYVVEKYGKAGDRVSPMPVISKPPISLSPVEVNAVIAWLQSKDDGDMAKITVPLPSAEDTPVEEAGGDEGGGDDRIFVDGSEPIDQMINTLGCPLCHTIPGIEGAVGELGPKLHEKTNAPNRIKDARYKGKATNTKEYVRESILNPGAYVVMNEEAGELFPDGLMPTTFKNQLSVDALDKLVDFISETEAK